MDHLHELDHEEDDDEILPQGSLFAIRVFLSRVCKLVTGVISTAEFVISSDIESENGVLLLKGRCQKHP